MATGYGLIPVRKIDGGQVRVRPYVVAAADSTALLVGDVVELDGTGDVDVVTQLPIVVRATAGHVLLGSVVGFLPDPTNPYNGSIRAASTKRVVLVCDDPDAVFSVQEDAVGNVVTAANIGLMTNADIIVASGNTTTGLSGTMLDSSTASASTANCKIVGVVREPGNVAAQSTGAKLEVIILEHALRTADSVT
jgi:hypothetical protein